MLVHLISRIDFPFSNRVFLLFPLVYNALERRVFISST